jgi:DNA-directed RNA polymerase subunit E'/Rpb7
MDIKSIILNEIIELKSNELDNNINLTLKNKLKDVKCNKENGQILEVLEIQNIYSLPINRNINPSFKVTFLANIVKPEIGLNIKVKIKSISIHGIICEYYNFTVFVPGNYIKSKKEYYLEQFGLSNDASLEMIKKTFNKKKNNKKFEEMYNYLLNPKSNDKYFYYKDEIKNIGDILDVDIVTIKYSKHMFTCIGKFTNL